MSLECGRKPENTDNTEKTHTDMGRTCKLPFQLYDVLNIFYLFIMFIYKSEQPLTVVHICMFRSSATRFRWIQNYYGEQDEWALDDIYIGQQCPNMCHGHGWCDHGHCRSASTHTHTVTPTIKFPEVLLYYFFFITLNMEAHKYVQLPH